MNIQAVEDFQAGDRARALVCWAARWDEIHAQLSSGGYSALPEQVAEQVLVAAVSPLAHPLIDRATVYDLIRDLRDAINQKVTYEVYGFLPEGWDSKYGDSYSAEDVEADLDSDINLALYPLLTAQAMSCAECRRTRPDVTDWQPVAHGLRCVKHLLVLSVSA